MTDFRKIGTSREALDRHLKLNNRTLEALAKELGLEPSHARDKEHLVRHVLVAIKANENGKPIVHLPVPKPAAKPKPASATPKKDDEKASISDETGKPPESTKAEPMFNEALSRKERKHFYGLPPAECKPSPQSEFSSAELARHAIEVGVPLSIVGGFEAGRYSQATLESEIRQAVKARQSRECVQHD